MSQPTSVFTWTVDLLLFNLNIGYEPFCLACSIEPLCIFCTLGLTVRHILYIYKRTDQSCAYLGFQKLSWRESRTTYPHWDWKIKHHISASSDEWEWAKRVWLDTNYNWNQLWCVFSVVTQWKIKTVESVKHDAELVKNFLSAKSRTMMKRKGVS